MTTVAYFDSRGQQLSGLFDMQTVFGSEATTTPVADVSGGIFSQVLQTSADLIRQAQANKLAAQYIKAGQTPPASVSGPAASVTPAASAPSWLPWALAAGAGLVVFASMSGKRRR